MGCGNATGIQVLAMLVPKFIWNNGNLFIDEGTFYVHTKLTFWKWIVYHELKHIKIAYTKRAF